MALRDDAYGSTNEVAALSPIAAEGDDFTSLTIPTKEQVETFLNRASGVLNMSLRRYGFDPAAVRANSTAKLACSEWVVSKAVAMVEKAQPGAGMPPPDRNGDPIANLYKSASEFVADFVLGLKNEGIAVTDPASTGLTFTGLSTHSERSDPRNPGREQPLFRRRAFDNPEV